jgi:phage-related protein
MAEGQQLDEGLGYLHAFITDLGEKQSDLNGVMEQVTSLNSTIEQLHHDFDEAKNNVITVTDARHEALDSAIEEAKNAVQSLVDEGHETVQKLADVVIHTFEEKQQQVTSKAQDGLERIGNGAQSLLEEGYHVADEAVSNISSKVSDLRGRAESIYDDLGSKVTDLANTAQETATTTMTAIQDAGEHVASNLSDLAQTTFGHFNEIGNQLVGDDGLLGHFTHLTDSAEQGFNQLGDFMSGLGDQLTQEVEGIVSDTVQVIEEEVFQRIQQEFEKVVVEAVEGLIADFAESIVMMTAGSAITAAITPFVPELAAAKVAVTAINDLLDALNPFD